MFEKCTEKIAGSMVEKGKIDFEDKEVYQFGIQQSLNIILNICTTIAIGVFLGMLWQAALYTLSFIPLRSYAGGYHASTQKKCYLMSSLMVLFVLAAIKYISLDIFDCYSIMFLSGIIILMVAPVGNENKELDEKERKVYKKRSVIILAAELLLAAFIGAAWNQQISICIVWAIFSVASLIAISAMRLHSDTSEV